MSPKPSKDAPKAENEEGSPNAPKSVNEEGPAKPQKKETKNQGWKSALIFMTDVAIYLMGGPPPFYRDYSQEDKKNEQEPKKAKPQPKRPEPEQTQPNQAQPNQPQQNVNQAYNAQKKQLRKQRRNSILLTLLLAAVLLMTFGLAAPLLAAPFAYSRYKEYQNDKKALEQLTAEQMTITPNESVQPKNARQNEVRQTNQQNFEQQKTNQHSNQNNTQPQSFRHTSHSERNQQRRHSNEQNKTQADSNKNYQQKAPPPREKAQTQPKQNPNHNHSRFNTKKPEGETPPRSNKESGTNPPPKHEEPYYNDPGLTLAQKASKAKKVMIGLGFDPGDDYKSAQKAYRKGALKFHPDKTQGDEQAAKKFQDLNNAWEILKEFLPKPQNTNTQNPNEKPREEQSGFNTKTPEGETPPRSDKESGTKPPPKHEKPYYNDPGLTLEDKAAKAKEVMEGLGFDPGDDLKSAKKAYRKGALKFHPDKTQGDEQAAKNFQDLNNAWEILEQYLLQKAANTNTQTPDESKPPETPESSFENDSPPTEDSSQTFESPESETTAQEQTQEVLSSYVSDKGNPLSKGFEDIEERSLGNLLDERLICDAPIEMADSSSNDGFGSSKEEAQQESQSVTDIIAHPDEKPEATVASEQTGLKIESLPTQQEAANHSEDSEVESDLSSSSTRAMN